MEVPVKKARVDVEEGAEPRETNPQEATTGVTRLGCGDTNGQGVQRVQVEGTQSVGIRICGEESGEKDKGISEKGKNASQLRFMILNTSLPGNKQSKTQEKIKGLEMLINREQPDIVFITDCPFVKSLKQKSHLLATTYNILQQNKEDKTSFFLYKRHLKVCLDNEKMEQKFDPLLPKACQVKVKRKCGEDIICICLFGGVLSLRHGSHSFYTLFQHYLEELQKLCQPVIVGVYLGRGSDNIRKYLPPDFTCKKAPGGMESLFFITSNYEADKIDWKVEGINHDTMFDSIIAISQFDEAEMSETEQQDFHEYLQKGTKKIYHARGMIVGCADAGKSTFLGGLMGEDLDQLLDKDPTRGIEIHESVFVVDDNNQLKVNTKGKERLLGLFQTDMKESRKESKRSAKHGTVIADQSSATSPRDVDEKEMPFPDQQGAEQLDMPDSKENNEQDHDDIDAQKENLEKILPNILSNQNEEMQKTISIFDFAGQTGYYASHQMYFSPGTFFIFVLDMNKKFDDVVEGTVSSRDGTVFSSTVFSSWTYKDYLVFWFRLFHSYSSPNAPAMLVATHTKGKEKNEIAEYFQTIWEILDKENEDFKDHLHSELEFGIDLIDAYGDSQEEISRIKEEIVNLASGLPSWGKPVRAAWAILEDALLKVKEDVKITTFDNFCQFVQKYPKNLEIENDDEVKDFLKFSHENGNVLYFREDELEHTIILDVKWLVDAFKCIIADKEHVNKDCKRRHVTDFNHLHETGELKESLLNGLWKTDIKMQNHTATLMAYMEHLGILAAIHQTEDNGKPCDLQKKWYIPCMNRRLFQINIMFDKFENFTSVWCFRFEFLPVFTFFRLVVSCMQTNLVIHKDGLYQSAAIFECKNHNILIGVKNRYIEVQIFSFEQIQEDVVMEIRKQIEHQIDRLAQSYEQNLKIVQGYKCRPRSFCDELEIGSFLSEQDCTKLERFQCPGCPLDEKHMVESITRYWRKKTENKGTNSYESSEEMDTKESDRYPMIHEKNGIAILINIEFKNKEKERRGSSYDVEALETCFKQLSFEVEKKTDLKAQEIRDLIKEASAKDHSQYNCIVIVVMSHGRVGSVSGVDREQVKYEELYLPLISCKSLIGKPKILFIQACRGKNMDRGLVSEEECDSDDGVKIPTKADLLMMLATFSDDVSFRHPEKGSIFIQELCKELPTSYDDEHLYEKLLRVKQRVAEWQSKKGMKQMPTIEPDTLRKKIYFK